MTPATIALVKRVVAEEFGVTELDLCSERQGGGLYRMRQVCYRICRDQTTASLPKIGAALGGRNYTTVAWGLKALERHLAADPELAAKLERARTRVVELCNKEVA